MPEQPTHLDLFSGILPAASLSPPPGQASAPSPSAKSSRIARKSSRKTSGLLPTLGAGNDHSGYTLDEFGGSGNPLRSIPTSEPLTEPDTEESLFSQQEFPASQQVVPGSAEAQATTVGFGLTLYESLVKHSRLGPSLKTLLASLLLKTDWSSRHCLLKWKATATKSARRLSFQLAASRPITTDTGYLLLPTLQGRDHFPPHSPEYVAEKKAEGHGMANLNDVLAMMPTLSARDWKSEKSNITDNARSLSEVVGRSSLKLTSNFCEAYQGFAQNWTAIDEPESMH